MSYSEKRFLRMGFDMLCLYNGRLTVEMIDQSQTSELCGPIDFGDVLNLNIKHERRPQILSRRSYKRVWVSLRATKNNSSA